jgi:hypothetical protein
MTLKPSAMVERDRRERYERGKAKIRPNGGEFVTENPHGEIGEAYEELLDCLNYLGRVKLTGRIIDARGFAEIAAQSLAAEIMERETCAALLAMEVEG